MLPEISLWMSLSPEARLEIVTGMLGPARVVGDTVAVEREGHWWLVLPPGAYEIGQRPEETQWTDDNFPGCAVRWAPHRKENLSATLVRANALAFGEIELDEDRLRLDDATELSEGHAFFHEDELSNVEAQVGRLCTSTEWEVCVRLLGSAAPYLVHGTPPSPSLLDQACWASSTAGSGWAQVHFCHGEAGWERRGGPGLFWPFQDRTEWLLTVPSVLVAAADLSIDTCVVRPSRRL